MRTLGLMGVAMSVVLAAGAGVSRGESPTAAAIRDYYGYAGRDVVVHERVGYPMPGVCRIVYEVRERRPVHVGQLILLGNERTRQNVIRRQLPQRPGQPLTNPKVG
jgi:outer membrane protein assembly factor BamA